VTDALATAPTVALAAAVRAKEISSRELLELFLDRIERLDKDVHAVVTLDVERARTAAAAADDRLAAGGPDGLGPLHGLPVTIKDAIETEGIRSTGGAVELTDHVPTADAPAVARLKAAGAVVFGKTNLPRWSGDLQSFNDIFGTTNNPWDRDRTPGGSSGGAAAAVACGFTSFELGTDIGGSVRIPSHFCGVYGLKPSYGVVPQRGYLDHVGGGTIDADINVFGPLARSADDLELLLSVLAGPEPERAPAWRLDLPAPRHDTLAGCRIGVWFDEPACPLDAAYAQILDSVASALAGAGATVQAAHPPVDYATQVALFGALVGAAVSPSMEREVGEAVAGNHLTWLDHDRARAALRRTWAAWFYEEGYDFLLCPVTVGPALPHDQSADLFARTVEVNGVVRPAIDWIGWTGLIGVVGLPSAVPPVGRTASGLPVGVQVVAPFLRDRDALRVAGLIAAAVGGGYEVPPGFA
jgi:amidase